MKAFKEIVAGAAEKVNGLFTFTAEEKRIAELMHEAECKKQAADQELHDAINRKGMYAPGCLPIIPQYMYNKQAIQKIAMRNRIMGKFIIAGAAVLNLFYGLFSLAADIFLWMVLPLAAMLFASYFVPMLGTGTHAEVATIIIYIVAAVAGIRAAIDASAKIKSFKIKF